MPPVADTGPQGGTGTPAAELTPEQKAALELEPGAGEEVEVKDGKTASKTEETPAEKLFKKEYVDRLRRAADKANEEAATLRREKEERERQAAEATGEYKKLYDELKAKFDNVTTEHGEQLKARDTRFVKSEVKSAAAAAGIIDPTDIALLDFSKIVLNDDGEVEGVDEAVGALKAAKPHLFKGTAANVIREAEGKPIAPNGGGTPKPKDAMAMSSDEFAAAWNALKRSAGAR